jgi:2-iminobutanoate/2-iminopropanoate deaminase
MMRHVNLGPEPVGRLPFSLGVATESCVFVAGQLAADEPPPRGGPGDIETETRIAMERIGRILERAGCGFADVVRVGMFMTHLEEFDRMNAVYCGFFPGDRLPARTCVGVASLLYGCRIEIDCIARIPTSGP